jgi:hypothetical protein
MPYRIVAVLLAEGVSLDRLTNRLTAFNMLESVLAPSYPAVLGKLVVVSVYEVDGERGRRFERVSVRDPEGVVLAETTVEVEGDGIAHRSVHLFQGVKLARPGTYQVTVEGANARGGPWETVGQRRLLALESPHPLSSGPAEVRGPAALTD